MVFHTYLQGVTSGTFNMGLSQGTPGANITTSTFILHRPSSPQKKDSGMHAHHQTLSSPHAEHMKSLLCQES
jgi:hypothetical protein